MQERRAERESGLFDEIIVDNFAGGGGASMGIEAALRRACDIAINHDPDAIAMHSANHPHTRHLQEDVWKVDLHRLDSRPTGLAWFSPDCFPAGTLVLTARGYVPIESVKVGELVLTHRGRWRRVTDTMQSVKTTRVIRGHGHHGLRVSDEHPFYVALKKCCMMGWVKAHSLQAGHYWSTPRFFFETPSAPAIGGRSLPRDARLWWLVGRYLACGWTRLTATRAELVICCGKDKAGYTRRMLSRWPRGGGRSEAGELAWQERNTATEVQFTANHRGLVKWLREHFGHLASGKRLAGWCYGLLSDERAELLQGYLAGDGWDQGTFVECRTVSKALAFGIKTLAVSLDYVPALYCLENSGDIQGRTVDAKPIYMLRWRHSLNAKHAQTFTTCDQLFTPIREVVADRREETVYNIGVEEDESYIAESIVVHNCKHFSRAKGGKPVEKKIRSLAWYVVKFAKIRKPRVIILENVREFEEWGPLMQAIGPDDRPLQTAHGEPVTIPDKTRKGQTFKKWVAQLRGLGYQVEWRPLNAADYGAPTHRRRLFLIARRDGKPIVWPEPTHGPGRTKPYRTAAECIDWTIPCPSIFERKRPLAEKTMRRIAMGIKRFVLDNPKPFIVRCAHGEGKDGAGRWGNSSHSIGEPLPTVTASKDFAVLSPVLVECANSNWSVGARAVTEPGPTVTARPKGGSWSVVQAFLAKHYGGVVGQPMDKPIWTITAVDHHSVVAASLAKFRGDSPGADVSEPMPTITSGAGSKRPAGAAHAMGVVAAHLTKLYGTSEAGTDVAKPMPTTTAGGNHAGLVAAFLIRYFSHGSGLTGQSVADPKHATTCKDRDGLVHVYLEGEAYVMVDIGLRMLTPRELATAQGFPADYVLTGTKSSQVARIGNSVCPVMAEVLCRANCGDMTARHSEWKAVHA